MLLKGEVGDRALKSHGNYIVDHGKSWKNHGIVFLNFSVLLYLPVNNICLAFGHNIVPQLSLEPATP